MTIAIFTQEPTMPVPYQNRRTIPDTISLIEKAATACATAGGEDPHDGFAYGLPETDTPADDITLAVQILRRAQNRLNTWDQRELRALAADLIHRYGSAIADKDDAVEIIIKHAEDESADNLPLYAEHIMEVQDMIRRAVIEIDDSRFNGLEGPSEPDRAPRHVDCPAAPA